MPGKSSPNKPRVTRFDSSAFLASLAALRETALRLPLSRALASGFPHFSGFAG